MGLSEGIQSPNSKKGYSLTQKNKKERDEKTKEIFFAFLSGSTFTQKGQRDKRDTRDTPNKLQGEGGMGSAKMASSKKAKWEERKN